jgi:hypothetical protein
MVRYTWEVSGTAADGQTWTTSGSVATEREGEFFSVPGEVMRLSFIELTDGRAVYGSPGLHCRGPYSFTRLLIEREGDAEGRGPGR